MCSGDETLAFNAVTKLFQASWVDDFHTSGAIMFSQGEATARITATANHSSFCWRTGLVFELTLQWLPSMPLFTLMEFKMSTGRRQFIQAAAAGAMISGAPFVHGQSKGKKYRTAPIGSGWWGMNILQQAMAAGNVKVVALCDVDRDKLEIAAEEVEDASGDVPKTFTDFRELLRTQHKRDTHQ